MSAPAVSSVSEPRLELYRCHRCSRPGDRMRQPMRVIGVFRNIPEFTVIQLPPGAEKFRCRGCGWINIFQPVPGRQIGQLVDLQSAVS